MICMKTSSLSTQKTLSFNISLVKIPQLLFDREFTNFGCSLFLFVLPRTKN